MSGTDLFDDLFEAVPFRANYAEARDWPKHRNVGLITRQAQQSITLAHIFLHRVIA